MKLEHIIRAQDFDRVWLERLFTLSRESEQIIKSGTNRELTGKKMVALFYEPSTRTRVSFESAMHSLGGWVMSTENAREFSSAIKGETLEDTIKVIDELGADVIVLRHYESGASEKAAAVSSVPIINAGDGAGQHPTQSLLDVFTIHEELGNVDNISVALVGDLLNGRTVRSLAYLLTKFSIKKIYFVAPDVLQMQNDILEYLDKYNVPYEKTDNLMSIADKVDVVYSTRLQKERFKGDMEEFESAYSKMKIDEDFMKVLKKKAVILHPLPRNKEIAQAVDKDPRAVYFKQVRYGLQVRIAILRILLK